MAIKSARARARDPEDVRSLCRAYTKTCVRVVAALVTSNNTPPAVRVAGAAWMMERGWGRAPQPLTGANGESDIRITIRNIIEGNYESIDGDVEDAEIVTIAAPVKQIE
jgi:hypothetical protein